MCGASSFARQADFRLAVGSVLAPRRAASVRCASSRSAEGVSRIERAFFAREGRRKGIGTYPLRFLQAFERFLLGRYERAPEGRLWAPGAPGAWRLWRLALLARLFSGFAARACFYTACRTLTVPILSVCYIVIIDN